MVKLKEKLMLALLILWAVCIAMLFTIQKAANMACNKIKLTSSTNFSNAGRSTVWEEPVT